MAAPTFTCDRCGDEGESFGDLSAPSGELMYHRRPYAWFNALNRLLCPDCQDAVRQDIDQFAGEGEPHGVVASSPVEAVLAREVPKDEADALRTVLTYEAGFEDGKEEAANRPVDLASDDRLIPLPGGRIAVAAQDLRVGDVVGGSTIVQLAGDEVNPYPPGTLVLLDKAAES